MNFCASFDISFQYYSKALESPFGQKVRAFYTTTSKQVLDIHEEAKRISASQTPTSPTTATAGTAAPATSDPTIAAATTAPPTTQAPTVV
jgi:hypothetical protein